MTAISGHLDSMIVLSRSMAAEGMYPAVDPLASSSILLDPNVVGQEHYRIAEQVIETIAHYRELQDIISLLGIEELNAKDRLAAAAERQQIAAERQALLEEARKEAEAGKGRVLAQSTEALAHQREEAATTLARQRQETEGELITQASNLSIDIAQRLLRRLPPETVFAAFLVGLETALEHLPDGGAIGLAATDGEHAVEIVTAAPLSEAQAGQVRALLEQAAGAPVTLAFRTEPNLIAGIEVHGTGTVVRVPVGSGFLGRTVDPLGRPPPRPPLGLDEFVCPVRLTVRVAHG